MQKDLQKLLLCQLVPEQILDAYVAARENYLQLVRTRPETDRPDWTHSSMSRPQAFARGLRKYIQIHRFMAQKGHIQKLAKYLYIMDYLGPFYLHYNAFLGTIEMLGDETQVAHWRKLVFAGLVAGAYGQTELGHGSDVKSLQTTATYQHSSKSFIIDSPTVTSVKFWPGGLGMFCTHAICQAQTVISGVKVGLQTFVVPVREPVSLKLLPGVKAGDLGPKFGFEPVDNGYLRLNKVRVDKNAMLQRFVQVREDGQPVGHDNKEAIKYGYGSMLKLRIELTTAFSFQLGSGCRLFNPKSQSELALAKWAGSFAVGQILVNGRVHHVFDNYLSAYNSKDFKQANQLLVQVHILSSTLKALSSWELIKGLVLMTASKADAIYLGQGLIRATNDMIPSSTYEGDNNVLLQQTAAFLLKKSPLSVPDNPFHGQLVRALNSEIQSLKTKMQSRAQEGTSFKALWNELFQCELIQLAKAWGWTQQIILFEEALNSIKSHSHYQLLAKTKRQFMGYCLSKLRILGADPSEAELGEALTDDEYFQIMAVFPVPYQREEHQTFSLGSQLAKDLLASVDCASL